MHVTCTRCAKSSESFDPPAWPEGWEGSVSEAVCPGCQYVEWHPLCEGIVDFGGRRVDLSVIARDEIDPNRLSRCEYLDLTVAWIGDERPHKWRCPKCGCTEFVGVHPDYPRSGLTGGTLFSAEIDEIDESE